MAPLQAAGGTQSYTCITSTVTEQGLVAAQDGSGMVVDAKGIYMVYSSSTELFLGVSTDGGESYEQHMVASGMGIDDPRITMVQGHLYATWTAKVGSGSAHYQMEAGNTSGLVFGTPKTVGETNGAIGSEVAAAGSNLYIVFIGADRAITAAVSHDYGSSFSVKELSDPNYAGKEINLAVNQSYVFVAYESTGTPSEPKHAAMLAVSEDNGSTFSVRSIPASGTAKEAILAVSQNGKLYVDYREGGGKANEIEVDRSGDFGARISKPLDVSNNSGDSREPWIAADAKDVYVSFRDTTNSSNGSYNVFVGISTDGGKSFTTKELSNETDIVSLQDDNYSPEVAASNGTVGVAWSSAIGGVEQEYISLSSNHGRTFNTLLLDQSGRDRSTLLMSLDGAYYAMWQTDAGVGAAVCK